jgi:acetyl-CoA acetyltransferase
VSGYDEVVACAPVTVPYVRRSDHDANWWLGSALAALLRAADLPKQAIDGLAMASFTLPPDGPAPFTQYVGLSPRVLDFFPTGGAAGVMALRRAARAVQYGDAEIVACLAGDTAHEGSFRELVGAFSGFSRDCVWPYGAGGPNQSFALLTEHAMRRTGATREDFGKLCLAQRQNAAANPGALLRTPLSMAEYLEARPIALPLRLYDCVMPCAGAEGFLVMRRQRSNALGLRSARILASIERHNAFPDDPVQWRAGWAMDRDALWDAAGIGPSEINCVQTYDDYPVIVMMQFQDLGFCNTDEGPDFIRQHDFTIGGSFPHNTGGGQLSCGQAGAAGGFLGVVEALRQVTGAAGERQVAGARHALASGFGMINYDRGLCTAAAVLGA